MNAREQDHDRPDAIELPAPSAHPMFAALGVALLFTGFVTHVYVSITGVVCALWAAVGWWREVLPKEHVEWAPLRPPSARAAAVAPRERKVERLELGTDGHRVRIPAEIHPYSAGVKGGLAGAAVMAALAAGYGLSAYGSLWYPVNLLAATALPSLAEAPTAELAAFNATAFALAAVIHIIVSIFVGLMYAALLPALPRFHFLWVGLIAPLVWSGLLFGSLQVISPVLNDRIDWIWFVASQVAFGLVTGFVVSRSERIGTVQTWPLAVRAGVEASGVDAKADEAKS